MENLNINKEWKFAYLFGFIQKLISSEKASKKYIWMNPVPAWID